MGNVIVKLMEEEANRKFLFSLMQMIHKEGLDYKIHRRPVDSKALDSFDGLLEINEIEDEVLKAIKTFAEQDMATFRVLYVNDHKEPVVATYVLGTCVGNQEGIQWANELLEQEVYYNGQTLSVHLGENPTFLETEDCNDILKTLDAYPFIQIDYNDHVVYAKEWFVMPKASKEKFVKDLENMRGVLDRYNIQLDCSLFGYDAELNLEKIELSHNRFTYNSYKAYD